MESILLQLNDIPVHLIQVYVCMYVYKLLRGRAPLQKNTAGGLFLDTKTRLNGEGTLLTLKLSTLFGRHLQQAGLARC